MDHEISLTITMGGTTYTLTPMGRQMIGTILAPKFLDLLSQGVLPDQLADEEWDGEPLFAELAGDDEDKLAAAYSSRQIAAILDRVPEA